MPDTDLPRTAEQIEQLVPRSDLHILVLGNVRKIDVVTKLKTSYKQVYMN